MALPRGPRHRTIVAVDVVGFGAPSRTDQHRVAVRKGLYQVIERAFTSAGIVWADSYREDRGDGLLILVPPHVPKQLFVDSALRNLVKGLHAHNRAHPVQEQLRLRMALHAGVVSFDNYGVSGPALTLAFRLLDAPALKEAVAQSSGVLTLIVSERFHDEVAQHAGSDVVAGYRQVQIRIKESDFVGWITQPDQRGQAIQLAPVDHSEAANPPPTKSRSELSGLAVGRQAIQVGQSIQGTIIHLHHDQVSTGRAVLAGNVPAWVRPQQIPAEVVPFVGRVREADRIEALLRDTQQPGVPVVLLTGAAGCGKSALAAHVAHRVADAYPDGQLWVWLEREAPGSAQSGNVLDGLLGSLGVPVSAIPRGLEARAAAYRSLLARRRVLIVLDGAEDTKQIQNLLPAGSSCAVIVTSRRDLPSLRSSVRVKLDGLTRDDSVNLLAQLAGSQIMRQAPSIESLLDAIGRQPLAVRMVGEILRDHQSLAIRDLTHELVTNGREQEGLDNQSWPLRTLLEYIYRQLGQWQATAFRRLAFLPGPSFEVGAVTQLLSVSHTTAMALLDGLAERNLLQREPGNIRRYRIPLLLRTYIRQGGDESLRQEAATYRVRRWYFDRANIAVSVLADSAGDSADSAAVNEALYWLEAERENLLEVAREAAAEDEHSYVWQLAEILYPFYHQRGHWADLQAIHEVALNGARETGNDAAAERILSNLGIAYREQRRFGEAVSCFEESVSLSRSTNSPESRSIALMNLAVVYLEQNQNTLAIRSLEEALSIARALDQLPTVAQVLGNIGNAYAALGRYEEALAAQRECLDTSRSIRDVRGEGACLLNLGLLHQARGHTEEAARIHQDALEIARLIGDRGIECQVLWSLGVSLTAQGKTADAISSLRASLFMAEEIGDMSTVYAITRDLGHAELNEGHLSAALRWYQQSRRVAQELGTLEKEADVICRLATAYESAGDMESALEHWRQGVGLLRESGDQDGLVSALNREGAVLLTLGRLDSAARCFEESAGIARDLGDPAGESAALGGLASAYDTLGLADDVTAIRRRMAQLDQRVTRATAGRKN